MCKIIPATCWTWYGILVASTSEELTNTKNILYITGNKSIVRKYREGVERGGPGRNERPLSNSAKNDLEGLTTLEQNSLLKCPKR